MLQIVSLSRYGTVCGKLRDGNWTAHFHCEIGEIASKNQIIFVRIFAEFSIIKTKLLYFKFHEKKLQKVKYNFKNRIFQRLLKCM